MYAIDLLSFAKTRRTEFVMTHQGVANVGRSPRPRIRCLVTLESLIVMTILVTCHGDQTCRGEESAGSVRCFVRLDGEIPQAPVVMLEPEMQKVMGVAQYRDERFLVGKDRGLANCVILLRAKSPDQRAAPKSLETQTFSKMGVRFEPRVLIVTPGTNIVLTNPKSPCRGFQVTGARYDEHRFSHMLFEGQQTTVRMTKPDICEIGCPLRPYARGFIYVADTPYFASTDTNGAANLDKIPIGVYEVRLWHESFSRKQAKEPRATVEVKANEVFHLRLSMSAPPLPADSLLE